MNEFLREYSPNETREPRSIWKYVLAVLGVLVVAGGIYWVLRDRGEISQVNAGGAPMGDLGVVVGATIGEVGNILADLNGPILAPGIALVSLVIGVNLLADGLRDLADPTRRGT